MSKRTLDFWQPRSPVPLTDEDAREIEHNLFGFFEVLAEWAKEGLPPSEGEPSRSSEDAAPKAKQRRKRGRR